MSKKFDELYKEVKRLHDVNAYHKRRGFRLAETSRMMCSNHLLEEVSELQAEACITEDKKAITDEAGDVMATFLHLIYICDIDFDDVANMCLQKLDKYFTDNPNEVNTSSPGFTRRSRDETHELRTLFHQLWTESSSDKNKWQDLANKIHEMTGIEV